MHKIFNQSVCVPTVLIHLLLGVVLLEGELVLLLV